MKLKELRMKAGYSQSQLANISGVSLRVIQGYEAGYRSLNKAGGIILYRLAMALDCEIVDLLDLTEK